jgi:hypothetical protein
MPVRRAYEGMQGCSERAITQASERTSAPPCKHANVSIPGCADLRRRTRYADAKSNTQSLPVYKPPSNYKHTRGYATWQHGLHGLHGNMRAHVARARGSMRTAVLNGCANATTRGCADAPMREGLCKGSACRNSRMRRTIARSPQARRRTRIIARMLHPQRARMRHR